MAIAMPIAIGAPIAIAIASAIGNWHAFDMCCKKGRIRMAPGPSYAVGGPLESQHQCHKNIANKLGAWPSDSPHYTYVYINPIKSQVTQCDKSRCLLF